MTTLSDPPKGGFRVSMLINDTRYRSYTFQFIALIALIAAFAYLGSNLLANLRAAGLNISYKFLSEPAGYDINQRLIEYTSQSTHFRAAIVGILNTLLVAVVACFFATVIGIFVGVLRLSNNWLVNKLMGIYVEIFRNVPVLIWILIIMAVFVAVLPQPREFRGDDATASMFLDLFAFTGRGFYFPRPYFAAEWATGATGWLIFIALLIASFFGARALAKSAAATQEATGDRPTTWYFTLAIWLVPLIAACVIMGLTWEIPELKGFNFRGGIYARNSFIALTLRFRSTRLPLSLKTCVRVFWRSLQVKQRRQRRWGCVRVRL